MPTVELDIRQLADEGGTAPLAPITVTDAVLDEDGNTLTDTISEIKSGLKYSSEHTETSNGLTLYYRTMGNICFGYVYGTPSNASTAASFTVPTAVEGYYYTGGQWAEASNPIQAWIDTGSNTFQVRNYVASRVVRVSFMYLCN